jgi:hypothetical protein
VAQAVQLITDLFELGRPAKHDAQLFYGTGLDKAVVGSGLEHSANDLPFRLRNVSYYRRRAGSSHHLMKQREPLLERTIPRRRDSENEHVTSSVSIRSRRSWAKFKFSTKFFSQNKKEIQAGVDETALHWQGPKLSKILR